MTIKQLIQELSKFDENEQILIDSIPNDLTGEESSISCLDGILSGKISVSEIKQDGPTSPAFVIISHKIY